MKIDIYTKAVLTVIAVSLSAIAIQMAIGTAHAVERVTKVAICDELGRNCGLVTTQGWLLTMSMSPAR